MKLCLFKDENTINNFKLLILRKILITQIYKEMMKKNLFNGLLILAIASAGVGTFSSCTDDNGDDLSITNAKVNALEIELDNLKDCKKLCEERWNELDERHERDRIKLEADIAGLDARISELEKLMDRLKDLDPAKINEFMEIHSLATNEVIENILNDIEELKSNINEIKDNSVDKGAFNEAYTEIINNINNIKNDINVKYSELDKKAEDGVKAWAWIEANKNRLDVLEQSSEEFKEFKEKYQAEIETIKNSINEIAGKLDAEKIRIDDLDSRVGELEAQFTDLSSRVSANEAAIEALQDKVSKLFGLVDRLNKLVTGIINQATTNPVFGYFNLPINVRSNMLMTYYGSAETDYTFPSESSAAEFNSDQIITNEDIEMLKASGNFQSFSVKPGDVLMDTNEGNAGMIFVTVNPNNVDFTGVQLPIVNSQDKESGIKLSGLKRSDKTLSFGYTRAADNGFYEAKATLSPEKVNDVAVNIEPGLKSAFKGVLQNRGKKDFAQLAKALYSQFSDILPANGLKASWTAPDGEGNEKTYSVYSNYDLAATAFSPLSFKFMEGQSIDHQLPIITPISGFEFDKDKFSFDIKIPAIDIDDPDFIIDLKDVHFDRYGNIKISIEVPTYDSEGNATTTTVEYDFTDDINKIIGDLESRLNETVNSEWNEEIRNACYNTFIKLKKDIQKQIDDMIEDVKGQMDDNIKDVIEEINKEIHDATDGYINDANKLIDKYNKVADKLNKFLQNPNHMLQTMMCYKGTDGDFHQLSNSKDMPSPFVLKSGNAISLYPTSYSAEIVAPSFKKFIAVTNVWNEDGKDAHSDATCKELLIKANSQEFMNQPITGKAHRVAFTADKAGYTYEIVYSALDYHGYTSTRKYYVTVK